MSGIVVARCRGGACMVKRRELGGNRLLVPLEVEEPDLLNCGRGMPEKLALLPAGLPVQH